MKAIYLLICIFFSLCCSVVMAQTYEKEVAGQVYTIDKVTNAVINKSNTISYKIITKKCEYFRINETTPLNDICRKVFSKEKIATLAKLRRSINVVFFCDTYGKVINMEFSVENLSCLASDPSSVTLSELNEFETLLKGYRYSLQPMSCPDVKYIPIARPFRFWSLLE